MTIHYLALNRGQDGTLGDITHGTGTPTADVFLSWDDTKSLTKLDVFLANEMFEYYLKSNGIPSGSAGTDLPAN